MKNSANNRPGIAVFPSELGWMGLLSRGDAVVLLVFACESPHQALAELELLEYAPDEGRAD